MSLAVFYVITVGVQKTGKKHFALHFFSFCIRTVLFIITLDIYRYMYIQHVYMYTGLFLFYFLTDFLIHSCGLLYYIEGNSIGSVYALEFCVDDGCVRDGSLGMVPSMNGIECLEYLLQPSR